jgi:hypothetical protein
MQTEIQFSIFLVNKPGVLAQILNALAKEKVNIIAMTLMDSVEHGVLRLVTAQLSHTREILKHHEVQVTESEVLCVNLPNKPGALAEVCTKLSTAHINISYCYVTTGARGGRTTGILKVADLKKALKILGSSDHPNGSDPKSSKKDRPNLRPRNR